MEKIAILAGVDAYADRWPSLNCSAHDVNELGAILGMSEFDYRVRKLIDRDATKANILREILEARNCGADSVLFYFSGHGASSDFGTYLVTYDNAEFDEGIELRKVVELLAYGGSAQQSLIILDCCHSGAVATASYEVHVMGNPDVQEAIRPAVQSVAIMAACQADQLAWEETNTGHGIFTHYLLQGMLGEAVDYQGNLSANTAYEYISRNMASHGAYGDERQKPVWAGHLSGRLILASRLTPALPPPPPEEQLHEIETEAVSLVEDYNRFRAQFDSTLWRTEGHGACSRKLEAIDKWFAKREIIQGVMRRSAFRQAQETLMRYRIELGFVEIGTTVPEGVLVERIGEGGFGTVWKVVGADERAYALKLYHPQEMYDAEKSRRFENGYDAMRMLKHPRIVGVHRYSRCPTGFVMDFIDGPNLRSLQVHAFMEPATLIRLFIEVAEAIRHAHESEVIHRDIKPENIVCEHQPDGSWHPFLTDFDLAWFSTKTQRATKTAMGVVHYAAPEQFFNFDPKAATAKTPALDIFSFGQLMYYCVTGRDPSPVQLDENADAIQDAAFRTGFDAPSSLAVGTLYRKCAVWEPGKRLSDFGLVLRDLRDIESTLLHTSDATVLGGIDFIAELISSLIGRPISPGSSFSYVNSAGTWQVDFSWKEKALRRKYQQILSVHLVPQGRIGLENVPNEQMRRTLNKRLDDALGRYSKMASRRSGTHGTYQVYVEIAPPDMSRRSIKACAEIVVESIAALSI